MRTTAFLAAAFAVTAFAAPAPTKVSTSSAIATATASTRPGPARPSGVPGGRPAPGGSRPAPPQCMSDEDATITADIFRQLIQGYTKEMALEALTEDFVDYSSAVSIIINKGAGAPKDVTAPIFTNRTQFMEGHGKQKPIPFETLNVWHNCNGTVSMRWKSTRSAYLQATEAAAIPVIGTAVLETEPAEEGNTYNYRIHTLYSEFNTAAWLVNLGVFKPEGPVIPVPASKRDAETEAEAVEAPVSAMQARDTIIGWYETGAL